MRKRFLIGSAALSLMVSVAQAADVEAPPEGFDWSGFYLGATAGYAWADADFDVDPNGLWEESPEAVAGIQDVTESNLNPEGFIGGLKLGWNTQMDSWVFGLEADINYVDAEEDEDGDDIIPGTVFDGFHNEAELSWLSTLRARAGIAFEQALLYATGGLALGDWEVVAELGQPAGGARFHESEWKLGWVVGGGIEFALSESWTINAEYLYADFGKLDGGSALQPPAGNPDFNQTYEIDLTTQIVRGGINYRF